MEAELVAKEDGGRGALGSWGESGNHNREERRDQRRRAKKGARKTKHVRTRVKNNSAAVS